MARGRRRRIEPREFTDGSFEGLVGRDDVGSLGERGCDWACRCAGRQQRQGAHRAEDPCSWNDVAGQTDQVGDGRESPEGRFGLRVHGYMFRFERFPLRGRRDHVGAKHAVYHLRGAAVASKPACGLPFPAPLASSDRQSPSTATWTSRCRASSASSRAARLRVTGTIPAHGHAVPGGGGGRRMH